ncbi:Aste57867_9763 [Aphanomyces stellatus]|uniref:Aste57867_9763 protein n=1 Tax=Aphanomyces stellatus TaxID=120398 RepID=A0A485KP50_9STRA|nr:hypothetical protein As57867_009724 [Aphanomyces stellatus]VFT86642.1 Aste57867_9763 [Aphanomyces stellatus]
MLSLPWNRTRAPIKDEKLPSSTPSSSSSTLTNALPPEFFRVASTPPSLLSTERRDELLQHARMKRIAWIEGSGSGTRVRRETPLKKTPSHLLELMKCADDLSHYIDSMDAVVAPPSSSSSSSKHASSDSGAAPSISLLEEIAARSDPAAWTGHPLPSLAIDPTFERAYGQLLDVLKHADAADLVQTLQGFIRSMHDTKAKTSAAASMGDKVHTFVAHFLNVLQLSPLVRTMERANLLEDLRDTDLRRDAVEVFVMEKLHDKVFGGGAHFDDDARLAARIASLGFLTFAHLDITATADVDAWTRVQTQLQTLPRYLSPRRQMDCILGVCQALTDLLKAHLGKYPGADEFLPALIYTILKANPRHLHSTVAYIQTFRHPSKLMSEPGYFFTHVVSSLSFLEHLDDSGLSITPEEFHTGLAQTKRSMDAATTLPSPSSSIASEDAAAPPSSSSLTQAPSVLDVRSQRRKKSLSTTAAALFTFHLPSFTNPAPTLHTFMHKSADDLRVQDVPRLLAEYKMLNVMCVQHGLLNPKHI